MNELFVYGTLLRGATQGGFLAQLPRTDAWMAGTMYRMPAGYPAVVPGREGRIFGELISGIDDRLLPLLDRLEGVHEGLYARHTTDVLVGLLRRQAFVYVGVDPERHGGKRVAGGRWRQILRRGGG